MVAQPLNDADLAITAAYHELRAPLSLIATAAHAAALETDVERTRKHCDTIARVAERALRVARQVVETVRVSQHAPNTNATHRPLMVLDQQLSDYRKLGLRIQLAGLERPEAVQAAGEAGDLEALLHVLLGEAIEHGDIDAPVHVAFRDSVDRIEISIANRVARGDRPGLGLGSFLRDRLIERLGARLHIEQAGGEYRCSILLRPVRRTRQPRYAAPLALHSEQPARRVS